MEWFYFALLRAVFTSGKDISTKMSVDHHRSTVTLTAFYTTGVSALILLPYVFWDGSWQSIYNKAFTQALFGNVLFNSFGHLLLLTTVRKFEVSYVSALSATSPLIFSTFSLVFFGELPSVITLLSMLVIGCGAILVELSRKRGLTLKTFFTDSAWLAVILYLVVSAIATVFSKQAVTAGDPEAYIAFRYFILCFIFLGFFHVYESPYGEKWLQRTRQKMTFYLDKKAIMAGFFVMFAVICEMRALQLADMGSVEALSKLSIAFTLVLDALLIAKTIRWQRWVGVFLILVGGATIVLGG